jgi:hypothetical protein
MPKRIRLVDESAQGLHVARWMRAQRGGFRTVHGCSVLIAVRCGVVQVFAGQERMVNRSFRNYQRISE